MAIEKLRKAFEEVPDEWKKPKKISQPKLLPVECRDYKTLITAWRKALKWTDGLDVALSVMLSSIVSTKMVGDQLWIKVVGPPSCGKSTLCEALSVARQYCVAKSTMRGFLSGFKSSDGEDHSLIERLRDKTLITKDGDTLLRSPELPRILSEARDIFDSVSRSDYRNRQGKDYEGVRMTWILCGTDSLRSIDQSELGERFLTCVIMDRIDDDLENEVLRRVAYRAESSLSFESDGKPESQYPPEMVRAMQLTGGYVIYLRKNATQLLSQVEMSDEEIEECIRLGKLTSFLRARPHNQDSEESSREFAARLVGQHVRLAKCLAVVLNKSDVDEEVLRRVRRVSDDTSRGLTVQIIETINRHGQMQAKPLSAAVQVSQGKLNDYLRFLSRIGVVVMRKSNPPTWKVSKIVRGLYG